MCGWLTGGLGWALLGKDRGGRRGGLCLAALEKCGPEEVANLVRVYFGSRCLGDLLRLQLFVYIVRLMCGCQLFVAGANRRQRTQLVVRWRSGACVAKLFVGRTSGRFRTSFCWSIAIEPDQDLQALSVKWYS